MIGNVLAHIAEGLFRPTRSVERLLERRPGVGDAALMVVAAYAVQRALDILLRPGAGALSLPEHLASLLLAVAYTFVIGFLVHTIGRAFGGEATREQALVAAGWHALVMTLLWPLLLIGAGDLEFDFTSDAEMSLGTFLVLAFYFAQWIWLLARYTAAIHGFRNDWNVVAVILGVAVLLSSLILVVAGG